MKELNANGDGKSLDFNGWRFHILLFINQKSKIYEILGSLVLTDATSAPGFKLLYESVYIVKGW